MYDFPRMNNLSKKTIHTEAYQQLIHSLVDARKRANLTQGDVANQLGYTQSYISKIENMQARIDPIQLINLSSIYKINIIDLLKSIDLGGKND
jgi:transcriptional regulator with XRE-family HTH domain